MRSFCLLLMLCLVLPPAGWAFNDTDTHLKLTEIAISNSCINRYLQEGLGINNGLDEEISGRRIEDWLKYGAEMEDDPICRASNHFHNPSLAWGEAGLSDTLWFVNGYCLFGDYYPYDISSGLTWATGYKDPNKLIYLSTVRSSINSG